MVSFLVIQTASIGDVILATPVIEKLHKHFPGAEIDILVKKGMEQLFITHPFVRETITWNKSENKYKELFDIFKKIRSKRYTRIINLQRFASTGFLTAFGGANYSVGFDKNPFSFFFTKRIKHEIGKLPYEHETDRNLSLIADFTDNKSIKPALYPSEADYLFVKQFKQIPYICIAPASLWFTKQYPENQWIDFITSLNPKIRVYLLGAKEDIDLCNRLISELKSETCINLAGKLTLMQSAALMKDAQMNFVNDSAPLHIASAMNAAVTAIFCSTVAEFGFGPLSDNYALVETKEKLSCRPCGLHGYKTCPEGHFRCATSIKTEKLIERITL